MNNTIMRRLFTILILVVFSLNIVAQSDDADYYFVYIVRDQTGPGNLIRFLENDYQDAINEEQHRVFYLANGNRPIIVEVSPENPNKEAFEQMLELIGRNERLEYFPDSDLELMLDFFKEKDFVDDSFNIIYRSVSWRIYATPGFLESEPDFIPSLFWVFDFSTINKKNGYYFTFEVYLNKLNGNSGYDSNAPFGIKNLGGINSVVDLMDYEMR